MANIEDASLVVAEEFVNIDTETRFGSSGWQEPRTDDIGRLYRDAQHEYGRCVGHVYSDFGGITYAVGWVFHSRDSYEGPRRRGTPASYLREVWVSCGLRDEAGHVYAYDVKRRRAVPLPAN